MIQQKAPFKKMHYDSMFPNANVLKMHLKFNRKIECSSCHNKIYLTTRKNVYFFLAREWFHLWYCNNKKFVSFLNTYMRVGLTKQCCLNCKPISNIINHVFVVLCNSRIGLGQISGYFHYLAGYRILSSNLIFCIQHQKSLQTKA